MTARPQGAYLPSQLLRLTRLGDGLASAREQRLGDETCPDPHIAYVAVGLTIGYFLLMLELFE